MIDILFSLGNKDGVLFLIDELVLTVMTNIWIVTLLPAGCLSVLLVQKGLIDGKAQGLPKDNLAISIQFQAALAVSCRGLPWGGGCLTFLLKGNT